MPMRNVLQPIEVGVVGRDFDTAFPAYRSVEILRARIVEGAAVDVQMIIMEAFIQRAFRGAGPHAVGAFGQHGAAASTEPEADLDVLRLGCLHSETGITLTID